MANQFAVYRHREMSATNMFNIHQDPTESLKKYFALFNEVTIKDVHPNQNMFVGAFQNELKVGFLLDPLPIDRQLHWRR